MVICNMYQRLSTRLY